MIRPNDTVISVATRFPDTQDIFDWYDIDPRFDGRSTLDEMADELGVEVEHMIEQLQDVVSLDELYREAQD